MNRHAPDGGVGPPGTRRVRRIAVRCNLAGAAVRNNRARLPLIPRASAASANTAYGNLFADSLQHRSVRCAGAPFVV